MSTAQLDPGSFVLPLRVWPDSPMLRLRSNEVVKFDDPKAPELTRELRNLVISMGTVMYAHDGVGLAAPQLGLLQRVVVLRDEDEHRTKSGRRGVFAFFNPRILERSKETDIEEEGCLSIPGLRVAVERSLSVRVEHETAFGETIQMEATGPEARVLQHEIDHLDGRLIIDHLESAERKAAIRSLVALAHRPA